MAPRLASLARGAILAGSQSTASGKALRATGFPSTYVLGYFLPPLTGLVRAGRSSENGLSAVRSETEERSVVAKNFLRALTGRGFAHSG